MFAAQKHTIEFTRLTVIRIAMRGLKLYLSARQPKPTREIPLKIEPTLAAQVSKLSLIYSWSSLLIPNGLKELLKKTEKFFARTMMARYYQNLSE